MFACQFNVLGQSIVVQVYIAARLISGAEVLLSPEMESLSLDKDGFGLFYNLLATESDAERNLTMASLLMITNRITYLSVSGFDKDSPVYCALRGKQFFMSPSPWDGTSLGDRWASLRASDPYVMRRRHQMLNYIADKKMEGAEFLLASVPAKDQFADNMRFGFRNRFK